MAGDDAVAGGGVVDSGYLDLLDSNSEPFVGAAVVVDVIANGGDGTFAVVGGIVVHRHLHNVVPVVAGHHNVLHSFVCVAESVAFLILGVLMEVDHDSIHPYSASVVVIVVVLG
uniref:Uncharacterized protein n=1 Tax=Strongyloides papillosus TaxID=174720 RepID=A0A0N5BHH7_STREA